MTLLVKRWYRSRRNQVIIVVVLICCLVYYTTLGDSEPREFDLDETRRYIEQRLQEALKIDKGTGCEIPQLDPFNKEVTQFDKKLPKINCKGQDWVKCWHSQCRVVQEILDTTKDIVCTYRDIIYETDVKYHLGPEVDVYNGDPYLLVKSDHAKVKCTGRHVNTIFPSKWTGHVAGFRPKLSQKPPEGREKSFNVLIFGFDSTSRNGFMRRMPHSYKYLEEELHATILKGYNIVGDGTPAALFPILTGKTELELPDVRKKLKNTGTLDSMPFIFYKLMDDGYRTAYFEDMPWIGTFQYRFNGFRYQPADHYLRSFYLEESASGGMWKFKDTRYCVGATPRYKLMMNLTDQFFRLDGKRFCFTFIADITHDDFNVISSADDDTVHFLKTFKEAGRLEDTLMIIMGDHGARYSNLRQTLQGKLEERLPLMAIILPKALKRKRPEAQAALKSNVDALTTPHDIHATVLDVLGMTQHYNPYKVTGADYTRGMTLLEPVPRNRSCSEAGIEPHWCACISWENITDAALTQRVANALLGYINKLTEPVRSRCVPRSLESVGWVMRRRASSRMLSFQKSKDADGYVGKFGPAISLRSDLYQVKITVGPAHGVYEASLTHFKSSDTFEVDFRDISRTNAYNNEPHCISATHPHLNMYCYCKN